MGVEPILHSLGLVNGIEPLSSLKGPLPDVLPLNYTSRNSLYSESICMKAAILGLVSPYTNRCAIFAYIKMVVKDS